MNASENSRSLAMWSDFLSRVAWYDQDWLKILFVSMFIAIFIAGLVGNLLTCTVIYSDKAMHTATNYYLFHVAVSDVVVSIGIFLEMYIFITNSYLFGNIVCRIHYFIVVALFNSGILVMTALAIERYIAIWHPLLLKSTPAWKRVTKVIICIWIIVLCETGPEMLTVELIKTPTFAVCYTVPYPFARIMNGILALVTFLIPLSILIFVYARIAFKVNVNEKSNSEKKIFNHKDNRKKLNKLVVAITLSFLICWSPFFLFRVLMFIFDMETLMKFENFWGICYKMILLNSWLSIVLNPLLFSLMSTKFRQALKMLWKKKFKRHTERLREHTERVAV